MAVQKYINKDSRDNKVCITSLNLSNNGIIPAIPVHVFFVLPSLLHPVILFIISLSLKFLLPSGSLGQDSYCGRH